VAVSFFVPDITAIRSNDGEQQTAAGFSDRFQEEAAESSG